MLCPHCGKEHPADVMVCPDTGLPLGEPVVCPICGRIARPGASFCAGCGAMLSRTKLSVQEDANRDEVVTFEEKAAIKQGFTRPSVSLVEQSRLKTRMAQINPPVSSHALKRPLEHSRAWRIIGYALLFLVILAGAAGLYLIWIQLR